MNLTSLPAVRRALCTIEKQTKADISRAPGPALADGCKTCEPFLMRHLAFIASMFLASLTSPASAQSMERDEEGYSIPDTRVASLPASVNGISYQLYIHVPPACGTAKHPKCSTTYLLDADYAFGLSALVTTHLSDRGRIPPLISVAIGYPDKGNYRLNRTRDYTPFHVPVGGYGPEIQRVSGGGPAFLEVIRSEIIPFIEANFPAASDERTLVGHSFGGLFALYSWMQAPELFDRYIIVSPSLWYGDGRTLSDVERACSLSPILRKSDLFLAVGEYEQQPESGRPMVSDLTRMRDILEGCRARPVSVDLRVFEDETHASIFPAALSTGLRRHFQ